MAQIEYTHDVDPQDDGPVPLGAGIGRMINIVGAAASLALVVGVGIWGYKLLMRDVSGVPVVRALEGPMRVQPDNPGGQPADHQGLAVNAVAAQGTAEAPADRLMLAPRPVALTDDDKPMAQLVSMETTEEVGAEETSDQSTDETIDALVAQLVGDTEPMEDEDIGSAPVVAAIVQPEPLEMIEDADDILAEPAVVTGPGLRHSLRPQVRPAQLEVTAIEPTSAPVGEARPDTVREVDGDTLPVGTKLAQLGAFDSPDMAREEWNRLGGMFEDYLTGKDRVIQKAESGGRTFYRLRAMGFDDINDARRFCSVLIAENADCIPVTTR